VGNIFIPVNDFPSVTLSFRLTRMISRGMDLEPSENHCVADVALGLMHAEAYLYRLQALRVQG